jgi:DNA-binding transcriptional MerR regulator
MSDRSHLSIGEVLSLLQDEFPDVTISKIRFLESQGLLDPERTPSGYRKFYEADVRRLRWILTEQRDSFLPLKVIKDRLEQEDGEVGLPPPDTSGERAAAAVPRGEAEEAGATASSDPSPSSPSAVPEPEAETPSDEPPTLPIWMADAARAKVDKGRSGRAAELGDGPPPLDDDPTTVSLTPDELLAASGLSPQQLRSLEEYGLVSGHLVGPDRFYDSEDLVIAQKAAGFLAHGVEARHLRMFKTTADREAALLEQIALPLVKQRRDGSKGEALDLVADLADLGQGLRAALLRAALADHLS